MRKHEVFSKRFLKKLKLNAKIQVFRKILWILGCAWKIESVSLCSELLYVSCTSFRLLALLLDNHGFFVDVRHGDLLLVFGTGKDLCEEI